MGKKKKKGGKKSKKSAMSEEELRALERSQKKYREIAEELHFEEAHTNWARLNLECVKAPPDFTVPKNYSIKYLILWRDLI